MHFTDDQARTLILKPFTKLNSQLLFLSSHAMTWGGLISSQVDTHRLAVAPLPGAMSWVSPVQADPEVPIIAAKGTHTHTHFFFNHFNKVIKKNNSLTATG